MLLRTTGERRFILTKEIAMTIKTDRLILREMTADDYDALYAVLADSDIMQHYPYTFDEKGVRDWTFRSTPFNEIYSYMKGTNEPSARAALSWGCRQVDEFRDEENEITKVFCITRDEWTQTVQ